MFERFFDHAKRVLTYAQDEARLLNHDFIETEHILVGLIREDERLAAQALQSLGISILAVRKKVEEPKEDRADQRMDRRRSRLDQRRF